MTADERALLTALLARRPILRRPIPPLSIRDPMTGQILWPQPSKKEA